MKRSDIVNKIAVTLYKDQNHSRSFMLEWDYLKLAEIALTCCEEAGMLPPKGYVDCGPEVLCANAWEPEE